MSHEDHLHSHAPKSFGRAFAIGVTLNFAFVVLEVVFQLSADLSIVFGGRLGSYAHFGFW
ncbi:MAG TPA: hypothetical protein VGI60_09690 [Chthoniobacterales bacterium]|jgi:hypothetical protein